MFMSNMQVTGVFGMMLMSELIIYEGFRLSADGSLNLMHRAITYIQKWRENNKIAQLT